jgi:diacylglycerol kinase (ATP)
MNSGKFSIRSRLRSFKFAFNGIWSFIKEEPNARIHLFGAVVAIFLGIILRITLLEWSLIAIVAGMVFVAELINTSLEKISDILAPEWNEKIKRAKDYSAAAVLISAIISLVVGLIIFLPRILNLFRLTN